MTVTLVTFSNKGVRKDFPVASGGMLIGRKTDADLRIPLREVSREHCRLSLNGKKAILKDLESSNGTFVNDQRIVQATLKPGDQIKIGTVLLTVQIDGVPKKITPPSQPQQGKRGAADAPTELQPVPTAKSAKAAATPAPAEEEIDLDAMEELDLDDVSDLDLDKLGLGDDEESEDAEDVEVLGEDDLEVDEGSDKEVTK
jgi:predicted component of type VI protein secretion system